MRQVAYKGLQPHSTNTYTSLNHQGILYYSYSKGPHSIVAVVAVVVITWVPMLLIACSLVALLRTSPGTPVGDAHDRKECRANLNF